MSYVIAAISNAGGAPEQTYRKLQSAGACPERPFAGKSTSACCGGMLTAFQSSTSVPLLQRF
jgi:hypothetical protein